MGDAVGVAAGVVVTTGDGVREGEGCGVVITTTGVGVNKTAGVGDSAASGVEVGVGVETTGADAVVKLHEYCEPIVVPAPFAAWIFVVANAA